MTAGSRGARVCASVVSSTSSQVETRRGTLDAGCPGGEGLGTQQEGRRLGHQAAQLVRGHNLPLAGKEKTRAHRFRPKAPRRRVVPRRPPAQYLLAPRIIIEPMQHRVWLRPCAIRAAGFPVRALEDVSLGEQRLETWDELEQEAFGWTCAERLDAKRNLEGFSTRTVWEVVEAIVETNSVEVMG
jgi:hypothetical protein